MADDWWASASRAFNQSTTNNNNTNNNNPNAPRKTMPITAPPSVATASTSIDPLLAGLSLSTPRHPETPLPSLRAPPAPSAGAAARVRRNERPLMTSIPDAISGVELHEVVERATGHARPPGKQDTAAIRTLTNTVRTRSTRLESVLKACAISADGRGGSPYNIRVLNLVHILFSAGAQALPDASIGVCGATAARLPPALKLATEAHRASRRARGVTTADVLGTLAYRDGRSLDTTDRVEASIYAAECYSVLIARRLTFASQFAETEFNYSLDRWYRRLGIENRAERTRVGPNNARQARLLAPDTRLLVLQIVAVASRTVILLARSRCQKEALMSVCAEACNAFAFSEYIRAKSNTGKAPIEEQKALQEAIHLVANGGVSVLMKFAGVDEMVAEVCLTEATEQARAVRIDSKHRRDIVCTFSTFMGLHQALDPFARSASSTKSSKG